MATPKTCPGCGERLVRVLYGYPSEEDMVRAQAGKVALGGCLVGFDDAAAACPACGATVWRDGTFDDEGVRKAVLRGPGPGAGSGGPGAERLEAHLHPDGRLEVVFGNGAAPAGSGDRRVVTVAAEELSRVLVMLCVERFATAEDVVEFCRRAGWPIDGAASGPVVRFTVDMDGTLGVFAGGDSTAPGEPGELQLPGELLEHFCVATLASLWREGRFTSLADWRGWLEGHGLDTAG